MSAGHTPGSWEVAHSHGYGDLVGHAIVSSEGYTIAVSVADIEPLEIASKANARLIAAAPDLLEALTDMLGEFDADEFGSEGQMQTCSVARAAIAKATGQ